MGLDYQDAVAAYDKEFANNMSIYNLVLGEKAAARSAYEYDQTAARANLQIYMNAISSGNMTYSNMDATQKLQVQKLEIQSGLPVGTIANMQMKPSDKILTFSDDKTQAVVLGANGQMQVISTGLSKSSGSTASSNLKALDDYILQKKSYEEVYNKFSNSIAPNTIYAEYQKLSPWGEVKESPEEMRTKYNVTTATTKSKLSAEDQTNINTIKQDIKDSKYTRADAINMFPEYAPYL
jgi:hypothetical protein